MAKETETDEGKGKDDTGSTGSTEDAPTPEEIEALRQENADLKAEQNKARTQAARDAKAAADKARKDAQESGDADALKAQLAAAETSNAELQARVQTANARAVAKELGAVDPAVLVRLLDFDKMADPLDEDEVGAAIQKLLREKPYLKGARVTTDAGGGGGGNTGQISMNDTIRRAAGRG